MSSAIGETFRSGDKIALPFRSSEWSCTKSQEKYYEGGYQEEVTIGDLLQKRREEQTKKGYYIASLVCRCQFFYP